MKMWIIVSLTSICMVWGTTSFGTKIMWKGRAFRNYYASTNRQPSPWEREAHRTDNLMAKIYAKQPDKSFLAEKIVLDSTGIHPEKAGQRVKGSVETVNK